jgi:hypothetical protein
VNKKPNKGELLPQITEAEVRQKVQRALELEPTGEPYRAFVQELKGLPPSALERLLSAIARQGQERAIPLLNALSGEGSQLGPASTVALGLVKSQAAAQRLLELTEADSKEIRKAARRGLHRLRSLGIQPEVPAEPLAQVPTSRSEPERRAWASAIDGEGSRFLFLAVPRPLGGTALIVLLVNDVRGFQEARVGYLEQGEAQGRVEEMARESGFPAVEIPFDYGRHLVKEARSLTEAAGRKAPTDYLVWREIIGEPEETWEKPPIYQELSAYAIKGDQSLLEQSSHLLDLREFAGWYLESEGVQECIQELERIRSGGLVLSPTAQKEREEQTLAKALEALFPPPVRARYRRRLEEMSYLLFHTGREAQARWALAAALAVEDEAPRSSPIYLPGSSPSNLTIGETSPLARHPFFLELLLWSLDRSQKKTSRGRKLIVAR